MGKPAIRYARGYQGMADDAEAVTRIREGHPEGYLLAFANLYQLFAQAIMARGVGRPYESFMATLPTVEDGVRGMAFIEAATAQSRRCFRMPCSSAGATMGAKSLGNRRSA